MQLCFEEEARILTLYFERKIQQTFPLWSSALHTAVTFLCEESYQRHTKNLLVFGFPAEGGVPPSIPPVNHETFVIDKGERHGVTVGETSPRGDIKEEVSSLIRFWILFS